MEARVAVSGVDRVFSYKALPLGAYTGMAVDTYAQAHHLGNTQARSTLAAVLFLRGWNHP